MYVVCVCVCIYTYVDLCARVCLYLHMCGDVGVDMCVHVYVCVCVRMCVCVFVRMLNWSVSTIPYEPGELPHQ